MVALDGERREVTVDLARRTVRVAEHEWPIQVSSSEDGGVTFEILGERVEVRNEPTSSGNSTEAIVVNGELHALVVEATADAGPRPSGHSALPDFTASRPLEVPSGPEGRGQAILPPMPGKVLEVRVRNGEKVLPGQVLLVVEAMKMRNEVTSPIAGEVAGLRVVPGTNVTAREVLLRVLEP